MSPLKVGSKVYEGNLLRVVDLEQSTRSMAEQGDESCQRYAEQLGKVVTVTRTQRIGAVDDLISCSYPANPTNFLSFYPYEVEKYPNDWWDVWVVED